jgi:uncharacterized membrane protein
MRRFNNARLFFAVLLSALALGAWGCGGGGGGGGGPAPAVEKATITGAITRGAPKQAASSARAALPKIPDTMTLVVVAVDEGGNKVSQVLAPPTTAFSLDVPVGHDYVLQLREGDAAGPMLAVVEVEKGRAAFAVKPGTGTVNLGIIEVNLFNGVGTPSETDLVTKLPGPASGSAILADSDNDGIINLAERTDTDGDGLPDGFEIASGPGFDPTVKTDPTLDTDGDGLTDVQEAKLGTNPTVKDTDGDGLEDGAEDANRNGVVDAGETNPALADTDGDGMPDGFELANGLNPTSAADANLDADLDGLSNLTEFQKGTNVKKADTDGDGLGDAAEVTLTTDPLNPDTDGDGVADGPDGFPLNPARFAAYLPTQLVRLNGAKFSAATAVNDIDQVVGHSDNAAGVINAVMWDTATGVPPFNPLQLGGIVAGKHSAAFGINNLSQVVGEAHDGTALRAVLWNAASPTASPPIALQLVPGDTDSTAYSINSLGQIVGESRNPATGTTHAVIWDDVDEAPSLLPALGTGTFSAAYFINDQGQIAGEATDAPNGLRHAALWTVDRTGVVTGTQDLGTPPGHGASVAYGVNDLGEVAGESIHLDVLDPHSVLWTVAAGAVKVTHLGTEGSPSNTLAVNLRGRIAGWNGTTAAVWDNFINPTKFELAADPTLLSAASPGLTQAYGINVKGTVVGMFQATDAAGAPNGDQAFVSVPQPQVVP